MANRLKKVLHYLISPEQSAFVNERQILDGPLIINEIISWAKHKKQKFMIFKTDIAKAYDSVAWDYLEEIMTEMGFGVRWRKWVRVSLSSGFSSILINGSPTDEFKLERGLRQGDPLSPFLFTLIMEGLSLAIKNSETLFGFKGINIGKNNVYLSHLFFADDAVFLAKCSIENALNLIHILFCFKRVSGLTVSMEKSKLFGVGITEEELSAMAQIMGCSHDKLPTTFLGIPLGVNMKRVNSWKPLIDKFNKKMSIWKRKTLSIGGRHTIVSNILGNMGNYWFSIFPVPATVIKHLEGLRRDFVWGYGSDQKYIPWVKWQEACKDKKYGGLGIGELDIMNKGLLGKWIWRFRKEKSALWVKIISSIHGADGGLLEDKNHSYQGNKWCCDDTLASIFPRLYALEENKEVKVSDRIGPSIEVWQRRRQPRGGREEEELDQLKNVIGDLSLSNREDDGFIPSAPGLGYTTRWLREEMAKKRYTPTATTFRWKKRIPKKTNVFMWRLFKDRLPVKTVLFNIGAQIPDQTCVFLHSENETLNHILLDCEPARYVWLRLSLWWQTSIPIFLSMDQVRSWIEGFDNRRKICDSLWILVIASLKALWDARNDKLYKSNMKLIPRLMAGQLNFIDEIGSVGFNSVFINRNDCWEMDVRDHGNPKKKVTGFDAMRRNTLSIGGRHTIVKNVLGSMGNFWLALFPIPKTVLQTLESLRRDFFWGHETGSKYIPWVKWETACLDKEHGGLGIGSLDIMNQGLLGKWIWRIRVEKSLFWAKIICGIHGEAGGLDGNNKLKSQGSVWNNILNSLNALNAYDLNPIDYMKIKVGNGGDTRFWIHRWCANERLDIIFPRLFALELSKNARVKDRAGVDPKDWLRRRQPRAGREEDEERKLQELLAYTTLSNQQDKWTMPAAPKEQYNTQWMRDQISKATFQMSIDKSRWIPKKANIFLWRFFKGRIPVFSVLSSIGAHIPNSRCHWCNREDENIPHLFFLAIRLSLIGLGLAYGGKRRFLNFRIWKKCGVGLKSALKAIWDARNEKVYKQVNKPKEAIFKSAQDMAFNWLSSRNSKFNFDKLDWIKSPFGD
ncbi:hypothetical protein LXL04_018996 [Taraxacum kok-saghyz]